MNLINKNSESPLLALTNSKRLEISSKRGWRARVAGEPMTSFPNWRKGLEDIRTYIEEEIQSVV